MIKFSIIVPVYNVEKYLKICINSILKQEYGSYEIILINDGSTDSSKKICEEYAKIDKRIKVINQKNGGLSDARNKGIANAKGKYIVFVDSDDWLCENALNQIKNILKNEQPDIIMNRIETYIEESQETKECFYNFSEFKNNELKIEKIFEKSYEMENFWGAAWMFVVNREYLLKNELFFMKGILHEDEEWAPRIILNSKKIAFNNECFYCNRANREGSITKTPNIKKEFDKLKIIDRLLKESKKVIYTKEKKKCLEQRCVSLLLGVIRNYKLYSKDNKFNELEKMIKERREILKLNSDIKYRLIYFFTHIIGVKGVNKILMR